MRQALTLYRNVSHPARHHQPARGPARLPEPAGGVARRGAPAGGTSILKPGGGDTRSGANVAFVPLAMPIMFGPGAIATILGMTSLVKHSESELLNLAVLLAAILATMAVTYLTLAYAKGVLGRIGPQGIDAATRIVGFFVSAIGMGLVFHGVIEALGVRTDRGCVSGPGVNAGAPAEPMS